jgi:hypothetical protein
MKPKEKAEKLVDQYYTVFAKRLQLSESFTSSHRYKFCKPLAKECAFVAVNELINDFDVSSPFEEQRNKFWNDVKKHIEKL